MAPNTNDKAEVKEPKPKKPPGWRNFQKLLKQVVTAPPMKKREAKQSEPATP